jgi:hypothetical protein
MTNPDLYTGMADLADTARAAATTDAAKVAYDRAWAAFITAKNHAILALRHQAAHADEQLAANRATADRRLAQSTVTTRVNNREVVMPLPEYHRLRAEGSAAIAVRHSEAAERHADEGNQQLVVAAGHAALEQDQPSAPRSRD